MEGLRGFAVFLVFLVHYASMVTPWIAGNPKVMALSNALYTVGNAGVDLFFVLSGYLIYGSLIARPQPFFRFMARRVERIYPAFVAVFGAYVALSFVFPAESKIPSHPLDGAIFLLQNILLLPGLFAIEPMVTVAWSLSYEMFYYLVTPLVIGVLGLRRRSSGWRILFFLMLAAITVAYCASFGGHVRLVMFVAGILLCEVVSRDRCPTPGSLPGLGFLCLGLLATLLPVTGPSGEAMKISILFVSFFVLCLSCFRDPAAWLPQAFSWTPLRWLGNMSYSYYLLHGLTLKACFLGFALFFPKESDYGPWLFWILLPTMFALTIIPTSALFLAIERPFSLSPRRKKSINKNVSAVSAPHRPSCSE